jgi:drug/metabolite transporter (DMT)-like permease
MNSIPQSPRSNLTRGYSIAVLAAVVLSTTAIFIRYLTQNFAIPALVLAFWRDLFAAASLFLILMCFKPGLLMSGRANLLYLAVYGFVLAVFNSFWTLSVALNGAAAATVLVYCSAAFTALLGWWLLKEQLSRVKLLAVGLSLGGCVLVADALNPAAWSSNLASILTGIISGLMYAAYSLMGRSASQRGLNPWTTLLYAFGFAAVYLLGFNILFGSWLPGAAVTPRELFALGSSVSGWGILAVLAVGPTLLGFGLYMISLAYLPSSVANLIVSLEPAFTSVTAYFLLGERLTGMQLFGGSLILLAVIFLRISEGRQSPAPLPEAVEAKLP